MDIKIRTQGFLITPAIRNYAKRRLQFALSSRGDAIQAIKVSLVDINGPKGGNDKRCKLEINLDGLSQVFIKDTQSDLYAAIDRACDRAVRSVNRKIDKHRNIRRVYIPEYT